MKMKKTAMKTHSGEDTRIPGLILDEEVSSIEDLDEVVEEVIIILRLKGQVQLYAIDVTNEVDIRNYILANLGDDGEAIN